MKLLGQYNTQQINKLMNSSTKQKHTLLESLIGLELYSKAE